MEATWLNNLKKDYKRSLIGITAIIFVLISGSLLFHGARTPRPVEQLAGVLEGKYLPAQDPGETAQQVTIGFYPINIYNISYESNVYSLSAYVWFVWDGEIDPSTTLEFTNVVDDGSLNKEFLSDEPRILPDGRKYRFTRINGTFYQRFDLHGYPLEKQELSLYMEDASYSVDTMYYQPDMEQSGFDQTLSIPGWQINSLTANKYLHDYVSNFGLNTSEDYSKYSVLKFSIEIERNKSYFAWKIFVPLLIILFTNWLGLLLNPDEFFEMRTYMPATALLTIIFLQISSLDALPQIGYLTLVDKVFVLSYVLVLITLVQNIIWRHRLEKCEEKSLLISRLKCIDRASFVVQIVSFLTVTYSLITYR